MTIFTGTDLLPKFQKLLPQIDEARMFYKQYELKHPGAIFNTSYGKVESALKDFLDAYDHFVEVKFDEKKDSKSDYTTEMLKAYRHLLYCFREYLDDCLHIVKTFIPPPEKIREDRNQYQWLKLNAEEIVCDFFKEISEYKKYIDASVNELKHNNGILGSHSFYSDYSIDVCVGYFVANVVDGCFEPVGKIHTKWHGADTGFSFRRDLAYNLYNVYYLAEAIQSLLTSKLGIDFAQITPRAETPSDSRKESFRRLMDLPRIHFPDEYAKLVPSISITSEGILKLDYPSHLSIKPNRLEKIMLTHSTDGFTGTYRILYAHPEQK